VCDSARLAGIIPSMRRVAALWMNLNIAHYIFEKFKMIYDKQYLFDWLY
jgi:hypothetical protein